jgi:hypothetical protein
MFYMDPILLSFRKGSFNANPKMEILWRRPRGGDPLKGGPCDGDPHRVDPGKSIRQGSS